MHSWTIVKKAYRDWKANLRKWEKQTTYERNIVSSVPPMHTDASVTEPVNDEPWRPG